MLPETERTTISHPEAGKKKRKKVKETETQAEEKKRSSEALDDGSAPSQTLELDRPNGLSSSRIEKAKEILLGSIAAFLESSGFSKTLSVFRSEAMPATDGWSASVLNLEDLFFKSLESRTCEETIIDLLKEQEKVDASKNGDCEKIWDASEQPQKKKRKHRNEIDDGTKSEIHKLENGYNKCLSNGEGISIRQGDALQVKSKEKGANKSKVSNSIGYEGNTEGRLLDPVIKDVFNKNALNNADPKTKDKKKKRGEPSSENLHAVNSDQLDGEKYQEGMKGSKEVKYVLAYSDSGKDKAYVSLEHTDNRKMAKKRKRLASEEGASRIQNETVTKEGEDGKLGAVEVNEKTGTQEKPDKSLDNESLSFGKKRKTEKSNENSTNGNAEKGREEDTTSTKNEKHSAAPKIKAFQRVKLEDVEFADERLQDNSYWAKGGADSGYGAKAQEVLGQVKGRGFRHEKTKKKRGTYRGGQIDFQSHSIKFNNSDEE